MKYEAERKFRLSDCQKLIDTVAGLGGTFSVAEIQTDTYFAHPLRDFGESDEALRIRSVGTRNYITYKGPKIDSVTKTRREIEIAFDEGGKNTLLCGQLLESLGFRTVMTVQKRRRRAVLSFDGRKIAVDLDSIDGLGDFVELEMVVEESELNTARECLAKLANSLGLSRDERRSYLELLLEQSASDTN